MKISTKGRYGLRILLDLALHDSGAPRMIRDIARSQQISLKYISRLIIELRKAGIVQSVRGSKGGYHLARAPKDLTLLEIVEVMEGPIQIVDCVGDSSDCKRQEACAARSVWAEVNQSIRSSLAKYTLQDAIDQYCKIKAKAGYSDYTI